MGRQEIAENMKWLAIEVELGRPNWSEVLRAGIELVHEVHLLAEWQMIEQSASYCAKRGRLPKAA